jgi:cell division protein FtsI/penicillin-binding protein 2
MLGRTDSRGRQLLVLLGLLVVCAALIGKLAYWQVVRRDNLAALAEQQTTVRDSQASHRGTIYDRTGTIVLASTIDRSRLVAGPSHLTKEERAEVAAELVKLLALEGSAATELTTKMTSNAAYVILAHGLTAAMADEVRAGLAEGTLSGLGLESEPARDYPQVGGSPGTSLAAHVLGFVNSDGDGQYGVEQHYQSVLAGQPRVMLADRTATGGLSPGGGIILDAGAQGIDLTLTIDAGLQLALEQELFTAWVADRAVTVSAVVMDPYTGAVYAEGSYPSYDANAYTSVPASDQGRFKDPVISDVYEPGSVFKMLTAIAGLETGVVTPTTRINDTGTLRLDGGRAHVSDADHKANGWMQFQDIVAYSRNVGAAKVALKLGKTTAAASDVLYQTWQRMGFGQPTGIDLSGEAQGIVQNPSITAWRQIDLANGSFGQGVAVTPIQLAAAYSAMVNGGTLVQPHVVGSIGSQPQVPPAKGQVLPADLSPTLISMLNHVITKVDFYRNRTLVPGYYVGGKTGTAQIWDNVKKAWKNDIFNYSFVGFIGKDAPRLVIAVQIHEGTPTVVKQGLLEMPEMSFELFRRIATDAITTLDLPPAKPPVDLTTTASR